MRRFVMYAAVLNIATMVAFVTNIVAGHGFLGRNECIIGMDFASLYTGGKLVLAGWSNELYNFRLDALMQQQLVSPHSMTDVHPFMNPPFAAIWYALYAMLPYAQAIIAWYAVGIVLLLVTIRLLARELFNEYKGALTTLLLLACLYYPTVAWLNYGQNSTHTLLLFTMFYIGLRRKQDFLAGVMLGLILYKPQLLLASGIMLLAAGRWRAIAGCAAGAAAWVALGFLICPEAMLHYPEMGQHFFAFLRARGDHILGINVEYPTWGSHSFFGFCVLLFDSFSRTLTDRVYAVVSLAAAGLLAWHWRRIPWQPTARRWNLYVAGTLALGLMISPHLFHYDLLLLLLPIIIVWSQVATAENTQESATPACDQRLITATLLLFAASLASGLLVLIQNAAMKALGLPPIALQVSVPIILYWVYRVRCEAETTPLPTATIERPHETSADGALPHHAAGLPQRG